MWTQDEIGCSLNCQWWNSCFYFSPSLVGGYGGPPSSKLIIIFEFLYCLIAEVVFKLKFLFHQAPDV